MNKRRAFYVCLAVLALFLLVESWLRPLLSWFPFYAWFRLGAHLYLVLPGKQGSVFLYQEYVHPFLEEHERAMKERREGMNTLKTVEGYAK